MKKTNFEDAKKILSDSGKAGRLIASSDGNWIIEYLPERQKEYEIKKNLINELALKKQKEEHLKKEKLKKQKILFEKMKKVEENNRKKEELKAEKDLKEFRERIALKEEKERLEKEMIKELNVEKIRNRIREKFSDAKIIIQYKRSGSGGKRFQFNEWGCWIIVKKGKYIASHESRDRVEIAKKSKTKVFKNKTEAIRYCNWLINHHWYSETEFFKGEKDFDNFPITKTLTEEEKKNAEADFIPYVKLFS
jgi:hypothetical protein